MVKIYDNTQVARQSMSVPYANAESFGNGFGRSMQQVGQGLSNISHQTFDIAKEKKDEYDTNTVQDLDGRLSKKLREYLNGESDENGNEKTTGVYRLEGKNALGITQKAEEEIENYINEIGKDTENSNQSRVFSKLANQRKQSAMDAVSNFERAQFIQYKADNTKASVENAIEDALANYTDSNIVVQSYNKGLAAILSNYAGRGELTEQKVRDYKTSFYKPMISKLSIKNAEKARSYYLTHKNEIAASDHAAIERMLQGDNTKQQSVQNADNLWTSGKSEREQLEEAEKIKNIEERDQTMQRVKAKWADHRRLNEQDEADKQQKQWDRFIATETAEDALDIMETVTNPTVRSKFEQEYGYRWLGKEKLTRYQSMYGLYTQATNNQLTTAIDARLQSGTVDTVLQERINAISDEKTKQAYKNYIEKGGMINTDPNVYVMLSELAERKSTNFSNIDLNHYIDRLSPVDRATLIEIQADLQNQQQGGDSEGKYTALLTSNDHTKRYMQLMGISSPEEYYQGKKLLETAVRDFEVSELGGKRKANNQEIDAIVTRMAGTFRQEDWVFDNDIKLLQIANEPVEKRAKTYKPFNEISGRDLSDLSAYLSTRDILGDPTKDNKVYKLYQKLHPAILSNDMETINYLIKQYKEKK